VLWLGWTAPRPLLAAETAWAALDRSPVDLALAPDGSWLVTANQTSHTISLVATQPGQVVDELPVGRQPTAVSLAADGQHVLVSSGESGELAVVRVDALRLKLVRSMAVGGWPHGVAAAPDGRIVYVALTGLDQIAVLDLDSGEIVRRIATGRWPRYPALSPDGTRLAVGTSGDRGVSVVDPQRGELLYIERFVGLNIGHLHASRDGQSVYFPWMVYRRNPISTGNIRLGWVLASRVARVRLDGPARRDAISLDPQGQAVADPFGLALTRDEQTMVISASGTHELLILRVPDLPFKDHGGTDHIDPALLADSDRFARVELGGRPMGLRIAPDDRTVFVANYLDNAVQVVDLAQRRVTRAIPLGGPDEPSPARRGEAIFLDARRSLDQWYSCHTCHYEGGSNAVAMDTDNDGTSFTFKSVLPLYSLADTAPYTWHGWQSDLSAAMRKSLTSTMLGPQPSGDDVDLLLAYLRTIAPPPNPYRHSADSAAIERGRRVFESDGAGCAQCHTGRHFTDGQVHDVGLGGPRDRYRGFNTPSLVGVWQKVTLLHDARSATLEELLTGPHDPARVGGTRSLSADELRDLVAYLKTL
jgi:YVTN family beta-propeller protein